MKHFEDAMKKIRPLSDQELNMYNHIAEQFTKPQMSRADSGSSGGGRRTKGTGDRLSPGVV